MIAKEVGPQGEPVSLERTCVVKLGANHCCCVQTLEERIFWSVPNLGAACPVLYFLCVSGRKYLLGPCPPKPCS